MHIRHTLLVCSLVSPLQPVMAEEFQGIEFPQGSSSFADEVVSYEPGFSGGAVPTDANYIDPQAALGPPDYGSDVGSVSLGSGGRITLRFLNNELTGSNDASPDLHIFEIGPDVEDTFVEISMDGTVWHSVGKVSGSTSSVDIDAYGFTADDTFTYVRLTDDPGEGNTSGDTVGADIDAVGAISTNTTLHTPEARIDTAVMVSFPTLEGSSYSIEESTDMVNWSEAVTGIQGDGSTKKFFFEQTDPGKFYRIVSLAP